MKKLKGARETEALRWLAGAQKEAVKATCSLAHCGCVIVNHGKVIGRGFNSPPNNNESQRMCEQVHDRNKKPKTDITCCVHAEWRAIIQALKNHPKQIMGSTLYFVRVNAEGEKLFSGEPYCTLCSRISLEGGLKTFVLQQQDGIVAYPTEEYNQLSYEYHKPQVS